jgi:hypothetical protein
VSILFGDAQQLNPVLGSGPYISNASRSQVVNLGILYYQAHDRIFVLNQNVRQKDQIFYYEMLMRIRDGSIKDTDHVVRDLELWNARRISFLSEDEKSCFTGE